MKTIAVLVTIFVSVLANANECPGVEWQESNSSFTIGADSTTLTPREMTVILDSLNTGIPGFKPVIKVVPAKSVDNLSHLFLADRIGYRLAPDAKLHTKVRAELTSLMRRGLILSVIENANIQSSVVTNVSVCQ